jgi:hypothetical protein
MEERLASEADAAAYAKRRTTVEPSVTIHQAGAFGEQLGTIGVVDPAIGLTVVTLLDSSLHGRPDR